MKNLIEFIKKNNRTIRITFEVFWILVFVLEMIANQTGSSIPQFVYVNF
jgi:hypothetical protein